MEEQAKVSVPRRRTPNEIRTIVAEFAGTGVTRTEFWRRHAMSLGTLNRYLQQGRGDGGSVTDGRLVAVEVNRPKVSADNGSDCSMAVVLPGCRRIEVKAGFDEPTFQRLVLLLEQV